MIFDNIISNKISNKWLKEQNNDIKNYYGNIPYKSNLIIDRSIKKKSIRKTNNLNSDSLLISCFDTTTGYRGVLNYDAYYKYLNDLIKLSFDYGSYKFCLKTKIKWIDLFKKLDKKNKDILIKFENLDNWIVSKDYSLDTYDWIGLSDIVISAPLSSIIFETYYAGVKIISYDPLNEFNQKHRPVEQLKNVSAHSFEELSILFKKMLN